MNTIFSERMQVILGTGVIVMLLILMDTLSSG